MNDQPRHSKAGVAVLAAVVIGGLIGLLWFLRHDPVDEPKVVAAPTDSTGPAPMAPGLEPAAAGSDAGGTPVAIGYRPWRPGMEHWYGNDPDPFIRQPHDYGRGTPEILGNRISYHVYDLETVQDMVRRGVEEGSEIARVKGRPLTESEREAARRAIQSFFDEAVPVVDGVIEGSIDREEGYELIGPRRWRLNQELRSTLGLSDDQFYKIWPHVRDVDDNLDQLREPEPDEERPKLPQDP